MTNMYTTMDSEFCKNKLAQSCRIFKRSHELTSRHIHDIDAEVPFYTWGTCILLNHACTDMGKLFKSREFTVMASHGYSHVQRPTMNFANKLAQSCRIFKKSHDLAYSADREAQVAFNAWAPAPALTLASFLNSQLWPLAVMYATTDRALR